MTDSAEQSPGYTIRFIAFVCGAAIMIGAGVWCWKKWGFWAWQSWVAEGLAVGVAGATAAGVTALLCLVFGVKWEDLPE